MTKDKKYRLAFFVSHPIHYKIDLYREINSLANIKIMVYFGSNASIRLTLDKTFGKVIKWYDEKIIKGLPHKFLKNYSFQKSSLPVDTFFGGTINLEIFSELKINHYDAILIDGYMTIGNWLAFFSAWLTKTPIILRGDAYLLNHRSNFKKLVKKIILTVLFKKIDAFLALSSTNADYYKYYGVPEEKIFYSPYVINNGYFRKKYKFFSSQKKKIKSLNKINSAVPIILYASKMIHRKRPMDLLKAYEILNKKLPDKAHLVFVGDGPEKKSLEDYTRLKNIKNVSFVGFKNQTDLPKFYAIADVFILPSEIEIYGQVVHEAMNFALPIIATDMVGAAYDVITQGKNGYVYKAGDINKLSEHLSNLIENKNLREEMGQNSLKIMDKFTYKEAVSGIVETLNAIKKPAVIVAQAGSHHLWQIAIGLQKENLLKNYATGAYYKRNKLPYNLISLLPKKIQNKIETQLKRRFYDGLNENKVKTFGLYEWLYILNSQLIKSQKISFWIINRRNKNFSKKIGKLSIKNDVKILWAGMDSALEAFSAIKNNQKNIKCILDQFIGHPLSLNKIIREEIQLHPQFKNIIKDKIPDDKIKRLLGEIELADVIAVGSKFVKKTLLENNVPEDKIIIIPYGVDTKLFSPLKNKTDKKTFDLLFVGNISVRKGCHYILEAVKQLNNPNIKLTMIGPMEDRYFLDNFGDYFKWLPSIPHNQIPLYYNDADIFVFPSLFEGSALVIYEALASGLPVITTPNSGSIVRNNENGFIIPIRDVTAIKEKIMILYANKKLCLEMAKNARLQSENFTWDHYHKKTVNLIKKYYDK